ncbi:DUF11 domain-containing protein [Runella sp.]|uniref:DUF11 domain-containing protein n=1 Tax=Runella sp. TaxID=1960881 RepID=UPI003D104639
MKKLLHLSSIVLLFLLGVGAQGYAQKGSFAVQLVLKETDCINNKVTLQVQVKANHADSTFLLGDANFRLRYSSLALSNPAISPNAGALSGNSTYSLNLQGSTQGSANGLVSLNVLYGGQSLPTLVTTNWLTVADLKFDLVSPLATNCVDLTWQTDKTPPVTGMSEIIVTTASPLTFTNHSVKASGVFNKLTLCPSQICQTPTPSTGSFGVQLLVKNFDCITKKVQVDVQVKAKDANSIFNMGDANFRFGYNTTVLSNPTLFAQNNYSGGAYTSQNLQGSGVSGSNGLVSLNVKYAGSSPPASVGTNWTSVGVVEFTFTGDASTACFDLNWQKSTDLPATGMNQITVTNQSPFAYTSQATASGTIYNNLTLCPTQYCTVASTSSYAAQLTAKSFDCVTKKAVILVKVRAKDANSTFLMGDANFRFNYNTTLLVNPKIVQQANFATLPYTAQDLQGSAVSGVAGIVSLNVKYSPSPGSTPTAQPVTADWVAVACIEFDYVGSTNASCFDLNWQTGVDFPETGMNEVRITGNTYTLTPVPPAPVFEKLTLCPGQLCQPRNVTLSIKKTRTSAAQAELGDVASFKLVIKNAGPDTAVNVIVVDSLPTTMQWVSATPTATSINGNVALWTIARIAPGDSIVITVQSKILSTGVSLNEAAVVSTDGQPVTIPITDNACVTVPIALCSNEAAQISVPARYTNVIWYRTFNGTTTQVGTTNVILVTQIGSYSFTATDQTCPASGCCPIVFIPGNCCPADLCIPFVVKKTKKNGVLLK